MTTDKLMTLWSGLSTDRDRAERLQTVESFQQRVHWHEIEVSKRETKHKQDLADLHKRLLAIQATCPHWLTTYHPDAAGGSDSWTSCDLCGVELSRDDLRKRAERAAASADADGAPDAGGHADGS